MKTRISELMRDSGVKFGTSGARGLATAMTDRVCYAYTVGFLQHLRALGELPVGPLEVAVGGDLRPSTGRIMAAVARAVRDFGGRALDCGRVPSPALALLGFDRRIPSIMVTGSHIPDDRNGIKFNKPAGELLKSDEPGMIAQEVALDAGQFHADGSFRDPAMAGTGLGGSPEVLEAYVRRYAEAFPGQPLAGLRVGVYQHSAVGREVLVDLLGRLGAQVTPLGRSSVFLPVDTEAIREEDVNLARQWAAGGAFDALVSADGDSDRPLVSDERGEWLRGDVAGILCARFLGADVVVTPVSSNTAVEKCGWFREVRRTRIGSPFVVAAMQAAAAETGSRVVGYEANGGFLIETPIALPGGARLGPLPTRDAAVVMVAVLALARREGQPISRLLASLPQRFTASGRLEAFPVESSQRLLACFSQGTPEEVHRRWNEALGPLVGSTLDQVDSTDGLRATWRNSEVLHLRPSGNAPEFRCYSEAGDPARASALCARALEVLRTLGAV